MPLPLPMLVADTGGLLEVDRGFAVTTGIECSAPVIAGGIRQDELQLTGHWERYEEDAALTASLGIRSVRYGIPFHVVAAEDGVFDWTWTDRALGALREEGLTPIADLLHFGLPDDIPGFGNPRLFERFLPYVEAFTRRYPWIRHYTPVNEPWITALFSARYGMWNERATGERSHVAAVGEISRCIVAASEVIRAARPDAVFLQSDVCERWVATTEETEAEAALLNEQRFLGFDLAYGLEPGPLATDWLLRNGLTERELAWLMEHGRSDNSVVGHDYYVGNHRQLVAPGESRSLDPDGGYALAARDSWEHFGLPFFLAETNRVAEAAIPWLTLVWNDALELLEAGLPVRGFCWYSLTDQVDWDTALTVPNGTVNTLGLVDLDRQIRPVGHVYAELARSAVTGVLTPLPLAAGSAVAPLERALPPVA